jgi:hypothetical protein
MKLTINAVVFLTLISITYSCEKEPEPKKSSESNDKDIPYSLRKLANDYKGEINALVYNIGDTLVFRCQGLTRFIPNLDTFKLKYVDSIALGIGKNVYLGSTGNNTTGYVKDKNGNYISTQDLGNGYFYIYSDTYQMEPDSSYSLVNRRFLYNIADAPFK